MFKKILIANRGEIACRVIRTARAMGIRTVAVYSEADRDALHVGLADEALPIGPPAPAGSYLNGDAILEAVRKSGADAVHPGYGFLSENAGFARRVARAGAAFIGPSARAIASMGDKIESKRLAEAAGVNSIPGHLAAIGDADEAVKVARRVGYPVMLKAAAGGGGKGMRITWNDAECRQGFARATGEATTSFGDGRLFLEKFVEDPRHIEIQVLGDRHGNVIHLGERECSIQRRHQKVIEESPSPLVDADMRAAMGAQAVALAKAVEYVSAGTVEFIVDASRNFYFLEMNTRLQVEHPVTELVTGLDLVELMIRVAAGERLPLGQAEVRLRGAAIEARIYAEDPFRGFLPSIGRLVRYAPPAEGRGPEGVVRVDTGVYEGGEISIHYDPMIAKLVAWAEDRAKAIRLLRRSLDEFRIRGVANNIAFLAALVSHPRFRAGRLSTGFIAEEYPKGFHAADAPHDDPGLLVAAAAAIHRAYQERASRIDGQLPGHGRRVADDWVVVLNGARHPVAVTPGDDGYEVTAGGRRWPVVTRWRLGDPLFKASIDGEDVCLQVERNGIAYRLTHAGCQADLVVLSPPAAELYTLMPEKAKADTSRFLRSPMPGLLVSLAVMAGQEVRTGETLAVVEAMKMENVLRAERDGRIAKVAVKPGDSLSVDQVILEFE